MAYNGWYATKTKRNQTKPYLSNCSLTIRCRLLSYSEHPSYGVLSHCRWYNHHILSPNDHLLKTLLSKDFFAYKNSKDQEVKVKNWSLHFYNSCGWAVFHRVTQVATLYFGPYSARWAVEKVLSYQDKFSHLHDHPYHILQIVLVANKYQTLFILKVIENRVWWLLALW